MVALRESALVSGRYRLEQLLGRGGMSEVWRAHDERLERDVAVKLLDPSLALLPGFEREAGILSRLRHPNILSIYDAGEEDGRRFLVMEYVDGPSLRTALEQHGAFLPEEAARIGAALAGALAYAHEHGVLHNDVKPENILLEQDGQPRLTDFGVAEVVGATVSPERAAQVLGTIAYLAPEVLQGNLPSEASDVYALALTVYEMAAGQLPFAGLSSAAVAAQKLAGDARPLRELVSDCPPLLEETLAAALSPSPHQRPAAAALAGGLRQAASQTRPLRRPPIATIAPLVDSSEPALSTAPARTIPPRPRYGRWVAVALAGGSALLLGGVALLLDSRDQGGVDPLHTPTTVAASPTTVNVAAAPSPSPTLTPTPTKPAPTPKAKPSPTPTPKSEKSKPGNGRGRR